MRISIHKEDFQNVLKKTKKINMIRATTPIPSLTQKKSTYFGVTSSPNNFLPFPKKSRFTI
jgi:hypothetical protein